MRVVHERGGAVLGERGGGFVLHLFSDNHVIVGITPGNQTMGATGQGREGEGLLLT